MRRCTVQSCKKIRRQHPDIVIYSLPDGAASDPNWLPVLKYGRPINWKPKKTTAICSEHFHPCHVSGNKLLPSAIPFRIIGPSFHPVYTGIINLNWTQYIEHGFYNSTLIIHYS